MSFICLNDFVYFLQFSVGFINDFLNNLTRCVAKKFSRFFVFSFMVLFVLSIICNEFTV